MFVEKQIKNLTKIDSQIAISGFIVSKEEESFVISDKTSTILVLSKEDVNTGDYIRVFGNLVFNNNDKIIQAGIIQNLNEINKELHQKILKRL
ncbi:MAG: hypothetical protein PHF86_05835 [Candidatus Nanoarchaeia archaeon]|nr:hypothetical protein [Candidatus Nanoarchaeia archaeon]